MSTPPPYPFRSRREIHSGEQKVYSDAELHEQHASQDVTVLHVPRPWCPFRSRRGVSAHFLLSTR